MMKLSFLSLFTLQILLVLVSADANADQTEVQLHEVTVSEDHEDLADVCFSPSLILPFFRLGCLRFFFVSLLVVLVLPSRKVKQTKMRYLLLSFFSSSFFDSKIGRGRGESGQDKTDEIAIPFSVLLSPGCAFYFMCCTLSCICSISMLNMLVMLGKRK